MEADYGSASQLAYTGHGKARLVCHVLEDRDVPQDPEVGVQGRGSTATYGRPAGQPHFRTLHPKLAHLLAHDDQPSSSAGPPEIAFTKTEIELLDRLVQESARTARAPPLVRNVFKLAQLGGYLARASDPPPGNTVIWRGMRRLTDIQLGYELAIKRSG